MFRRLTCTALTAIALVPGIAKAVDPAVQTSILDAIEGMQNLPYANVDYNYPPVVLFDGGKLVFEGSFQPLNDGTSRLHAELRRALPGDVTYTGRNSPIIEDTPYRQASAFPSVSIFRKQRNLEVRIWFAPPRGTDNFPTLRGMVTDLSNGSILSCAQSVISSPVNRTINNERPAAGQPCSFGSKLIYGRPDFNGLGIELTGGVGIASDPVTALYVCKEKGFDGVADVRARSYSSPRNNTIAKRNGTDWQILNARAYNSRIEEGGLLCFTEQL
jgi:hypothetical protein